MRLQSRYLAKLVKKHRLRKGLSQKELSYIIGYKNGQFISNVERELCSIPVKVLPLMAEVFDIDVMEFVCALEQDYGSSVRREILKVKGVII